MKQVIELEQKIREACRPLIGKPIALSGGIDSAVIASIIQPKFAVSVKLPGGDKYNEIKHAKKVAKHLGIKHIVIEPNQNDFDEAVKKSVKAIGRPIPHFNIFPLYTMYQYLWQNGETELVLGDGPDESMCGYTRHLIMDYLYHSFNIPAFQHYGETIKNILNLPDETYANIVHQPEARKIIVDAMKDGKNILDAMCMVDMELMRPDMNDMSNGIAKLFGITNHRPYEEKYVDDFMFGLPPELKVHDTEYGKYALRLIAEKYLPKEIAWRKHKMGGPVYPVNKVKKWMAMGEFDKTKWIEFQQNLLNEK